MKRIIAHLDMDAFFAAIEERDTPQWRGLPIVVGANPQGGKGRGVVSTANYKAREYGIKSALPIRTAWQYSERARREGEPPAVFVEPDIEKYARVSEEIIKIVRDVVIQYTEARPLPIGRGRASEAFKIEQASIDEMYLDLSFASSFKKASEICKKIKEEIKKKERLTASVGIGQNKLIAKIASDQQKPDGLTVVNEKEAAEFLEPLSIRAIPGIGPKTEEKLVHELGVTLVRNLKNVSLEQMEAMFGKWGVDIYYKARGIDEAPLEEENVAKSIGEQETFLKDTLDANFIIDRLALMCKNITKRLKAEGFNNFRAIVITVRFKGFETITRSHTLPKPADSLEALKFEAIKLLMPFFDKRENPGNKLIRLFGVRVEKLK